MRIFHQLALRWLCRRPAVIAMTLLLAGMARGADDEDRVAVRIANTWGAVLVRGPFTCTVSVANQTREDLLCDVSERTSWVVDAAPRGSGLRRRETAGVSEERKRLIRLTAGAELAKETCLSSWLTPEQPGTHVVRISVSVRTWRIGKEGRMEPESGQATQASVDLEYHVVEGTEADWTQTLGRLVETSRTGVADSRRSALECLLSTEDVRVIPALEGLFDSDDGPRAVQQIRRLRPAIATDTPSVVRGLRSTNGRTVAAVLTWSRDAGFEVPAETIERCLTNENTMVRYAALEYLDKAARCPESLQSVVAILERDSIPTVAGLARKIMSKSPKGTQE